MQTDATYSKMYEGIQIIFTILRSKWHVVSTDVFVCKHSVDELRLQPWIHYRLSPFCSITLKIQMST